MLRLPPLKLVKHGDLYVVRDDIVPGGTKQRALQMVLPKLGPHEYVYAGPVTGFAGLALSYACQALGPGYSATVFQAYRETEHARTLAIRAAGGKVMMVRMGFLSNVKARAKRYCNHTQAVLLPWGLDDKLFHDALVSIGRRVKLTPEEVWTVAGSGVLSRALQEVWPEATFYAVNISQHKVNAGRATVLQAPERFEQDAKDPPPFPSTSNYDAKAWRFIKEQASPGALFWNVAC